MALFDRFRRQPEPDHNPVMEALRRQRLIAERQYIEAVTDLVANYVDPDDAFLDSDGKRWDVLGGSDTTSLSVGTQSGLAEIRKQCRELAESNEFAICGHENRISYIVGSGHNYKATAKPKTEVSEQTLDLVQAILDDFVKENTWHKRQQEIVRRKDRDGECFLRLFETEGGLRIRFVEPGQVATPNTDRRENATLGIITDPNDVETVTAYWIDNEQVPADQIQHRKANVDVNVKRGLPLFWPVRKNLGRVERLLRNMGTVAEIQAAIALIRKHGGAGGEKATVTAWMQNKADATVTTDNKTTYHRHYAPGTIIDAPTSAEYDFPAKGIDASRYVKIVQAELRGIASRLVMPEFMLTSDASNANYSSTMVAEGPAVKIFQRLQWELIEEDLEILGRVLDMAVARGDLSEEERAKIDVDATPPTVATRDRLQETQADKILVDGHAMSITTWQLRNDLDPEHETELIDDHREKMDPFAGMDPMAMMRGGRDNTPPDNDDDSDTDDDAED